MYDNRTLTVEGQKSANVFAAEALAAPFRSERW